MPAAFEVQAPRVWGDTTELVLTVRDDRLRGSRGHFIRLDIYPVAAPSQFARHHGYFDVPLRLIQNDRTELSISKDGLAIGGGRLRKRIRPAWKGKIEYAGYITLHSSLWEAGKGPPRQIRVMSSGHCILPPNGTIPLENIDIPVSQRCNLSCPMCQRKSYTPSDETDLTDTLFSVILKSVSHVHHVHAQGIGEPLMHPRFFEILKRLRTALPKEGRLGTCTNGTLLTRENTSKILKTGIDYLYFSIDGSTGETAEVIRPGLDFGRFVDNVSFCVALSNGPKVKRPWYMFSFAVMPENIHEMSDFVRLAGSLGVDSVRFGRLREFPSGRFVDLDEKSLRTQIRAAREVADKNGVILVLPRLRRSKEQQCRFMQTAFLKPNGDVIPCCNMRPHATTGKIMTFGNILGSRWRRSGTRRSITTFVKALSGAASPKCVTTVISRAASLSDVGPDSSWSTGCLLDDRVRQYLSHFPSKSRI